MLILLPPSEKKMPTPVATPAMKVYAGVLYEALDYKSLSAAVKKKAEKSLIIISAKYGAIGPMEKIKSYKAKIDNAKMKSKVAAVLDQFEEDLIIDCRSSTYQGVWTAPNNKCLEVRIFQNVNGVKKVITHMSKKTRGEIVRLLLSNRSTPKTPRDVRDIVNKHYTCALVRWDSFNPWILEVIAKEKEELV